MILGMDEDENVMSAAANEDLILVDESDRSVGHLSKELCHRGRGVLHRAFSVLLFNAQGELLIQQRSAGKRLWPLYWSNSCCSHPRGEETLEVATRRRLMEELGVDCSLHFLYKFQYHAQFDEDGAENELCSVFIGRCTEPLRVNREEIAQIRFISPEALQSEISDQGDSKFTPWFLSEWARIRRDFRTEVHSLTIR